MSILRDAEESSCLLSRQIDLAMFVAKVNFASVCRVANVATLRRAAQCALVCGTVTTALTRADVNLGLQARRSFTKELRRTGEILIRCGEADLAAAGEGVNAITPCGVAGGAMVCENGHPCFTGREGRTWRSCFWGPMLLCSVGWLIMLCFVETSTIQLYAEWPIV